MGYKRWTIEKAVSIVHKVHIVHKRNKILLNSQFFATYSNSVEQLYESLKIALFQQSFPFAKRIIVVPSGAMKVWLSERMANDPQLGIFAGIQTLHLEQAIMHLLQMANPNSYRSSLLEMALSIEKEIGIILSKVSTLSPEEYSHWSPLFTYLKNPKRITQLSAILAELFLKYDLYGQKVVCDWKPFQNGWQQTLWLRIMNLGKRSISQQLSSVDLDLLSQDMQLHLFALSYLPTLYVSIFKTLSYKNPVYSYIFSPCSMFWSDYISSFSLNYQENLDLISSLKLQNPLLASFGKVGREMAKVFEETDAETEEKYVIHPQAVQYAQYENLISADMNFAQKENTFSILNHLQTDFLLARPITNSEKISFLKSDRSIQMHSASSPLREVQILYDAILSIIDENSILPRDIVVMAPNIEEYAPYIHWVFGSKESVLSPQVMDLSAPKESSIVQDFLKLIYLSKGKWEPNPILELFESKAFRRKHKISDEEAFQISDWIETSPIYWGEDVSHRKELYSQICDDSPSGTWDYAFGKLLLGLVQESDDPVSIENMLSGTLLGKLIHVFRSLRKDLTPFSDNCEKSLVEWSKILEELIQDYFSLDDQEKEISAPFCEYLFQLRSLENCIGPNLYPFQTVLFHLEQLLNKPKSSQQEHSLNSVRFCSMRPMRVIPSRVIALLGMHETAYPRRETSPSLNLLAHERNSDYSPSQADYDRFLFLETILSAQDYLLFTYQGYDSRDGKEQSPSLLLSELFSYLDKTCEVGGALPSETCLQKHPFHPFHHTYFDPKSSFKSYSKSNFYLAQRYYYQQKSSSNVCENACQQNSKENEKSILKLNLNDLLQLAKNPIKTFFNNHLGIYLEKPSAQNSEFDFSFLKKAVVGQKNLSKSAFEVIREADNAGNLPFGSFKKVAVQQIERENIAIQNILNSLNLTEKPITIAFSENIPLKTQDNHLHFPPLKFFYKNVEIHLSGQIPMVTSAGILAYTDDKKENIFKNWPLFLAFSTLVKMHSLPFQDQLMAMKKGKGKTVLSAQDNPQLYLQQYIEYYFIAAEKLSPLIPEWVSSILSGDVRKLDELLNNRDPFNPLHNEYAQWCTLQGWLKDPKTIINEWQPIAKRLFTGYEKL